MKTILLSQNVAVRIRKSRTRQIRISVSAGGAILTLPYFVSYRRGFAFLKEKEDWVVEKFKEFTSGPTSFLRQGSRNEFKMLRTEALRVVEECVRKYAAGYDVLPKKISIRNQKTRWGSCSQRETLCFSYRLILLPERLREYVIVHELSHLREFNHSPAFWALVARVFPDYRGLREELKRFPSPNN